MLFQLENARVEDVATTAGALLRKKVVVEESARPALGCRVTIRNPEPIPLSAIVPAGANAVKPLGVDLVEKPAEIHVVRLAEFPPEGPCAVAEAAPPPTSRMATMDDMLGGKVSLGGSPQEQILYVLAVNPGGHLDQCGLRAGDSIIGLDGKVLTSESTMKLFTALMEHKGNVTLKRGDVEKAHALGR